MANPKTLLKLSAAPDGPDIDLVTNHFCEKCNCYAYAVQDYLGGYLGEQDNDDFNYLPRPGQSRGVSYLDLMGTNLEGMRRAVHEDGLNYAGLKYPRVIPPGHYVICCFLEPGEYHFIRQNRDGSWSSKDGMGVPTTCDWQGNPLKNPEDYYGGDKNYRFVGYFFVPEGGIRVGVRACETNRLRQLEAHTKNPQEKIEKARLKELVALTDAGDKTVAEMRKIVRQKRTDSYQELHRVWSDYEDQARIVAKRCKWSGYTRRSILKNAYTRPKNAKDQSR